MANSKSALCAPSERMPDEREYLGQMKQREWKITKWTISSKRGKWSIHKDMESMGRRSFECRPAILSTCDGGGLFWKHETTKVAVVNTFLLLRGDKLSCSWGSNGREAPQLWAMQCMIATLIRCWENSPAHWIGFIASVTVTWMILCAHVYIPLTRLAHILHSQHVHSIAFGLTVYVL